MAIKSLPSSIWTNPLLFIATGFGLGSLPYAPGTWGTLAAIPIYLLLHDIPLWLYGIFLAVSFTVGVFVCDYCQKVFEVPDHPGIVWDEMVGYWLTMFAVPYTWTWLIAGFILFRLFDIWKPWPIKLCESKIKHGGLSIMLDDIVAAIYAAIILQLIIFIVGLF